MGDVFRRNVQVDAPRGVGGRKQLPRTRASGLLGWTSTLHGTRTAPSRWPATRRGQSSASAGEPSPPPAPPRPPWTKPRRNFPRAGPWPPRRTPKIPSGSPFFAVAGGAVVFEVGVVQLVEVNPRSAKREDNSKHDSSNWLAGDLSLARLSFGCDLCGTRALGRERG